MSPHVPDSCLQDSDTVTSDAGSNKAAEGRTTARTALNLCNQVILLRRRRVHHKAADTIPLSTAEQQPA